MVEGPGATRNGWKLKSALHGKVLQMDIQNNKSTVDKSKEHSSLYMGLTLRDFFTVGKELFLIFSSDDDDDDSEEEVAMRLHFGMNGCLFVGTNPKIPPWRKKECHNLKMSLIKPKASKNTKQKSSSTSSTKPYKTASVRQKENQPTESILKTSTNNEHGVNKSSNHSHVIDLTSVEVNHQSSNVNSTNTLHKYFLINSIHTKNNANDSYETARFPFRSCDPLSSHGMKLSDVSSLKRKKYDSDEEHQIIIVETRNTTVSVGVSANMARSKLQRLASLDVCSPSFHAAHVYQAIVDAGARNENLIISDALLNQNLFPGIGNIIKIESLHRAKIDPRRKVSTLGHLHIRKVVAICRQFSMHWLNCVQTPPKLVYNRTSCGTCNQNSIQMQKIGGLDSDNRNSTSIRPPQMNPSKNQNYLSRVTFWCTFCQPFQSIPNQTAGVSSILSVTSNKSALAPSLPINVLKPLMSCPKHGDSSVILRRVHSQSSPNLSRLFQTCRKKDCEFFCWADTHFPYCQCHQPTQKAVLKISKTDKSGGRWFFCCSKSKGKGCGYFLWANKKHLEPFGSKITPLL